MIVWQDKKSGEKVDALCRLVPKKKFELLTLDCLCRENDGTFSTAETETGRLPDRSFRSFFLYYEGKRLAGELFVFPVNENTAEITAIVDPCRRRCGIFSRLFECAKEEMEKYGITGHVLIAEPDCQDARDVIRHMDLSLSKSEYVMEAGHEGLKHSENADDCVSVRYEECDGITTALMYLKEAGESEIPIGQAKAARVKNEAFIFEVEILKDCRGRGYGEMIVGDLMRHLDGSAPGINFKLQVSSDNEAAYGLYKKLGFKTVSQLDYFVVDKNIKP